VRVPELPGVEFPGTVARVASALVPGSRTLLQTEIDVPNPDGVLTPGTYCEVELQISRKTQSLVVPAEVLIFNRDGLNVAALRTASSTFASSPWSAIAARRSRSATV
jgi:multidrug efflux pump subunit AcrA (membrane-fusion protein)